MAKAIRRRWKANPALQTGLPRQDRRSCDYNVYVPDRLQHRDFTFEGTVAADVADAERGIARLNERATTLVDTEALARLLLRAESVASSKIEGLEVGARRLLQAVATRELGETSNDVTATEVLANIDAMTFAMRAVAEDDSLALDNLTEVHRRLLKTTRHSEHAGRLRTEQNWIGGSSFNPCSADFVPPPPELVKPLLQDLCAFCNHDSLPAVAQAAIAHAQFETIHPFVDGNGRVGRTLIYIVMRRRALISRTIPPVSLVLATRAREYVAALNATRYVGPAEAAEARTGINKWVSLFAAACTRAVADTEAFEERIRALQKRWRQRLGPVRAGSATDLLLRKLPGTPILTVQSAASLTGRSVQAANEAIRRLADAGVLTAIRARRRHRAFEAKDLLTMFTDLERRLASPYGDTAVAAPARKVPYRRV